MTRPPRQTNCGALSAQSRAMDTHTPAKELPEEGELQVRSVASHGVGAPQVAPVCPPRPYWWLRPDSCRCAHTQTPYSDGSPMPELGTPFSTPAAARETPVVGGHSGESPSSVVPAHKEEEASACAQATVSALAGLTVAMSPSTPSPPKASPRAAPAAPQETDADPDCCLLDAAAAPPLPPVAYPYLSSLNDVVSKSYVLAGATVGLALGMAYSLRLTNRRPPL